VLFLFYIPHDLPSSLSWGLGLSAATPERDNINIIKKCTLQCTLQSNFWRKAPSFSTTHGTRKARRDSKVHHFQCTTQLRLCLCFGSLNAKSKSGQDQTPETAAATVVLHRRIARVTQLQ
jgi:hypothetical protein